ncbi:lytic polysaccharide monooxygenase auxiliary activity family 9 protein [Streptomyces sp. MP131-18]|uniref:lytic polysaccharide monooxygenase auxiliary activity family 9 protein n=1 Tax=Streptomyces sp. MP131-18 TaxID=1857892 RepID=UPI00097C7FD1|nr:lytic polysaccharide monooxygenase auxiliary activity family 9 protein [Streptomyces sp. MP131-18]ONK09351.1 spherodin-like protein [Streptomyces sp. MP131-18]
MRPADPARSRSWLSRGAVVALATALCTVPWTAPAHAHGTVIDPASRNYSCWLRWADDWQNPALAAQDPMCWQAWQDDPDALLLWDQVSKTGAGLGPYNNWNVPDGQLCSAGGAAGGRYDSLDAVGSWHPTVITDPWDNVTVSVHDSAMHGADYYWIYVSRPGYDPTTEPLSWDDLELTLTTGSYGPDWGAPSPEPHLPGRTNTVWTNASTDHSGPAVVLTVWKLADQDEFHFLCSDVLFS